MKTAISLPDRVFREAEATARRLKVSRSELYRRALEAFISAARERDVTASYDAGFAVTESVGERAFRRRASRKALSAVEWNE